MSPVKCVQEVVRNCAVHLAANYGGRFRLPKKAENSFKMGLDTSPELETDTVSYYYTIIGIFRWIIELGNICLVEILSILIKILKS